MGFPLTTPACQLEFSLAQAILLLGFHGLIFPVTPRERYLATGILGLCLLRSFCPLLHDFPLASGLGVLLLMYQLGLS